MLHAGLGFHKRTFRIYVKGWGPTQGAVLSLKGVTWTESSTAALLTIYYVVLKPAYNETARDRFFSVAARFCLIQAWVIRTSYYLRCKFSYKDRFPVCSGFV
jgi:hypothetical protein